jgi:hypothetical protein
MKTLLQKISLSVLFFIVCLTVNAQIKKTNEKALMANKQKEQESLTAEEIIIGVEEYSGLFTNADSSKKITGILNLKIKSNIYKGLTYKLYDNSGKLIACKSIDRNNISINLHNIEAENYVLNITNGEENIKTFGFYH